MTISKINRYKYKYIYVDTYLCLFFITNKGLNIVTKNIYVNVFANHSSDRVTYEPGWFV